MQLATQRKVSTTQASKTCLLLQIRKKGTETIAPNHPYLFAFPFCALLKTAKPHIKTNEQCTRYKIRLLRVTEYQCDFRFPMKESMMRTVMQPVAIVESETLENSTHITHELHKVTAVSCVGIVLRWNIHILENRQSLCHRSPSISLIVFTLVFSFFIK